MGGAWTVLTITIVFLFLLSASAQALQVFLDSDIYELNQDMQYKVISDTVANVSVAVNADNATAELMDSFTINVSSTGATQATKSQSFPTGNYKVTFTQGSSSINSYFTVVDEILFPDCKLMGSAIPIYVETNTPIDAFDDFGGNFTDLLALNQSQYVYYGNYSNLTGDGRVYHFVVIDEQVSGVYDTVYIDDDKKFQVFNDSEDNASMPFLETSEGLEGMVEIDSSNRFIIADMDTSTGQGIFMIVPRSSPSFTSSDMLYMLDLLRHENDTVIPNQTLNITIYDEDDAIVNTNLVDINEDGYINASVNLSGFDSGKYFIFANDTPVDVFKVESFKLHAKITDLSDNPSSSFAPNSKVKVWAVSRNVNGNLIDLDSVPSGTILLPDGTTSALTFTKESTGVYTAESSALTTTGEYKITVQGSSGSDTESFSTGFDVQSVGMEVMTLNPKYLDEGTGEGTMVSAFAPNSNVSAAIFLLNSSKGSGLKSGGPPCGNDGSSCIATPCNNSQFDVVVKDDNGNKHVLDDSNFTMMTIDSAATWMGVSAPEEPGLGEQCMLVMWDNNSWASKSGNYKVEIGYSNSSVGDLEGGASFSIQRLIAMGSTVDSRGDSFSFFSPNSTVRVKIDIRDMVTDELLNTSAILDVKITEMWREWPTRKNALTEMSFNKTQLNESLSGDKLTFTSPPEEGFYVANFRFKANVLGTITEGTGMIFFELKKYMIWAELSSAGEGNWYVKSGDNIVLSVNVMDIDMGARYGESGATVSCTGCEGLVVNISSLRNEQYFKEMEDGVDYVVQTGVIANSTSGATLNITPQGSGGKDLPSGWYGIDIMLTDPNSNNTYYGWGWFEIRNFYVDVFEVEKIESGPTAGNYTMAGGEGGSKGGPGGGATVPVGGSVLLGVAAFQPPTAMSPPSPLTVTTVTSEGMMNERVWPPVPISDSLFTLTELGGTPKMVDPWCDKCPPFPIKVVNLTVDDNIDESMYMLSLRVSASGAGTDVGGAFLTVSSYQVNYESIPASKMYEWPPVYATTERLSMRFNGTDFDNLPYNLTNVTIDMVFSHKSERPIRFKYGLNYSNNCTGNTQACALEMNLSGLSVGEYMVVFEVTDENGAEQEVEYMFEIKNLLFAVPQIYEGWSWDSSTPDKELEAWYGDDRCDNERWLQQDKYAGTDTNIVTIQLGPSEVNITMAANKSAGTDYGGGAFCIITYDGGWRYTDSPSCSGGGLLVYVVNNGTDTWINTSTNMISTINLTENSSFVLTGLDSMNWTVKSLRPTEPRYVKIKLANDLICGRNDLNPGAGTPLIVVPPAGSVNHSSFYHGPNSLAGSLWGGIDYIAMIMEIPNRSVYVYQNTSHLWLHKGDFSNVNFTNASAVYGPYAVGDTVNDGYGGLWSLVKLSKSKITLRGINVLERGIYVNTSLSTSGTIRIGALNENEMGFENKFSNEKGGMDLDGDGYKNGTLFFVIIDQGNGYDTVIYSDATTKWNFTNTSRMVNTSETDRTLRTVGIIDNLTLLNIDPRANRVKFYDPSAIGEWAELGDSRMGDNITIPVVIKSPDGTKVAANISIPNIKQKTDAGMNFISTGLPAVEINGLGEITINVSSLGLSAGRYEFELQASSSTYGTELLNEWMWPNSVVRNFLVDVSAGYGGITTDFVAVSATKYGGGESSGRVLDLTTINGTDWGCPVMLYEGVAARVNNLIPSPWSSCPSWAEPGSVLTGTNYTYSVPTFDYNYYVYFNQNDAYGNQTIWINQGDCDFSSAPSYNISEPINITLGSDRFMFYLTNISFCNGGSSSPTIYIGVDGLNSSIIEPYRMDDWGGNRSSQWSVTSINRSGIVYNAILANDSGLSYPQAGTWGVGDPIKAAWLSENGRYDTTNATKHRIGSNFTANEYIASLGPDAWSGMLIADASNLSSLLGSGVRPGMDLRIADMQAYFGKINESAAGLDLDLNLDGDKNDTFYSVAFDDFDDGNSQLMRIYTDDDLNITEPWWADSNNPDSSSQYYDFYGNETGMAEREGNPPTGMWGGNMNFGPENDSLEWKDMPSWNIKAYNGTNLILEKNIWQLSDTKAISITLKVFDFAQNPLQGANVTLTSLQRFGGGQPFKTLNASDYTLVNTQNTTDSNGYAMIKLQPAGSWLNGAEYIAAMTVAYGGSTETMREWFRVGANW
jgi:hypothetical protein